MVECAKKHAITIIAISLIVVAVVVTVVVVVVVNNKKKQDEDSKTDGGGGDDDKEEIILTVLKNDSQLKKPNVKLNAEFEYVKMGNNMTGLIISDPYASTFHIQFSMKYGGYIGTVSGISHFGEHMVLQNCEKYNYLYPILNMFSNFKNSQVNAATAGTFQMYYITLPFNLYYEKAMDMLTESFRHPLYSPEIVKNEIQAVNHEFYDNIDSQDVEENIIRQLSNSQTSFNGMLCGNNQTLIPSESDSLSKKLKGYHMVIKNPNRIFFTLYSNKTMNESKEIAKKYLNYKMHVFPDNEIDIEDKKKLEQNLLDIESKEIFDDKLYKHGFYYNTKNKINILQIYYYIGNAELKNLKFNIIEYTGYLLKSESLMKILIDRNYILMDERISAAGDITLDNNIYFKIPLLLTDHGFENIKDILIIINKYMNMIKEEGYKQEYFNDYVKYSHNTMILNFNKASTFNRNTYLSICLNKKYINDEDILYTEKIYESDYNQELLKELLSHIKFEKSFYSVSSKKKVTELDLSSTLNNIETKKLRYFDADFVIGEIPEEIYDNIIDSSKKIEGLEIRKTSLYFSSKCNENVIPCYKEDANKCKEKNEFDFEKEEKYAGTKLNESDDHYITYYQIDKSSESHLVYSRIKFIFDLFQVTEDNIIMLKIEKPLMKYKLLEILEIPQIFDFDMGIAFPNLITNFKFKAFSDNIGTIVNKFIDLFSSEITEENFNYTKLIMIEELRQKIDISFQSYIFSIFYKFNKIKKEENYDLDILNIENITYLKFIDFHKTLMANMKKIYLDIAGNINKELVEGIHNHIKETIKLSSKLTLMNKLLFKDEDSPEVINYYQKSTMNFPENGIIVAYKIPDYLANYTDIFNACFNSIAFNYLRFNYTNGYTPFSAVAYDYFIIYEQGLFKEVDQMEDDINKVLSELIERKINISTYNDIKQSYLYKGEVKKEKNMDYFFDKFTDEHDKGEKEESNTLKLNEETKIPETFKELVDIMAPMFTQPKRSTILIARNTLSDADFDAMYQRRSQIREYLLNKTINISHTKEMTPW